MQKNIIFLIYRKMIFYSLADVIFSFSDMRPFWFRILPDAFQDSCLPLFLYKPVVYHAYLYWISRVVLSAYESCAFQRHLVRYVGHRRCR